MVARATAAVVDIGVALGFVSREPREMWVKKKDKKKKTRIRKGVEIRETLQYWRYFLHFLEALFCPILHSLHMAVTDTCEGQVNRGVSGTEAGVMLLTSRLG